MTVDFGGSKLTNLTAGVAPTDAATVGQISGVSTNNMACTGTWNLSTAVLDANSDLEVTISAPNRIYGHKTITGSVTGTGEAMNPLHVVYNDSGNSGAFTSKGHTICARANVGFAAVARGTTHNLSSLADIQSVDGTGDSEYAGIYGFANKWGASSWDNASLQGMDYSIKGPIATLANRPNLLTGQSWSVLNMAPMGSITTTKRGAVGHMMATVPGMGPWEVSPAGSTSYPFNFGFKASGWSGPYNTATDGTSSSATAGYDVAFSAGGAAGGVMTGTMRSNINIGFQAEDYTGAAYKATNPHPSSNGIAYHTAINGAAANVMDSATNFLSHKFRRSEGSIASPADVSSGTLGEITYEGYKNSAYRVAARVTTDILSVGTSSVAGKYKIAATDSSGTEHVVITAVSDKVYLGGPDTAPVLQVANNPAGSANYYSFWNNASGSDPFLRAEGTDTNIGGGLLTKGTGNFNVYYNSGGAYMCRFLAGGTNYPVFDSAGKLSFASTQVLTTRRTGWTASTGTATRTAFATSSVTLPQLAEQVKALKDDLIAHGLIGT